MQPHVLLWELTFKGRAEGSRFREHVQAYLCIHEASGRKLQTAQAPHVFPYSIAFPQLAEESESSVSQGQL